MPSWLPSIPYPAAGKGYWLEVTSTLNWCEEDYNVSQFTAEFVNSLTNLLFIYLAIKGIVNCMKYNHDRVFLVTFVGYLVVGIGSFLFHSTLKYPMQLVDELSMIYTTCIPCFSIFSFGRSRAFHYMLGTFLVGLCAFITIYYYISKDPIFHQVVYGILTAVVVLRSGYLMEITLRPFYGRYRDKFLKNTISTSQLDEAERARRDLRDLSVLKLMWKFVFVGLTSFIGGFLMWNLDNTYCSSLIRWRKAVGLPWGVFLEGHGWWHILTAFGAYIYINWGILMRACLKNEQDNYEVYWPTIFSAPEIIKKKKEEDGGNKNTTPEEQKLLTLGRKKKIEWSD